MSDRKALRFTQHALDAMAERELPALWVEAAVHNPEWQEADPHDASVIRRFRTIPERGGRVLRVALVETAVEIRILSAFLDRRAKEAAVSPTVKYDPEANAAYIRFSADKVAESEEVSKGIVLDYDAKGRIVGMEVMDARAHLSPELLTKAA